MLLHETAGLIRRRFEQTARPEGLTLLQWRALGLLAQTGPMRQVAVGEALEASPMAISDLAERLASAGLVERARDPKDSRAKTLALTAAGQERVTAMRTRSEAIFAEVFRDVSHTEAEALGHALTKIKRNLGDA